MVVIGGWSSPIPPGRWEERLDDYKGAVARGAPLQHMVDIVRSIIMSGRAAELGATTSHFDLVVAAQPADAPPFDVIVVRTSAGLRPPKDGYVRIEHQSVTGRDDRIERPVSEAVGLFWRFVIEKFGIEPAIHGTGPFSYEIRLVQEASAGSLGDAVLGVRASAGELSVGDDLFVPCRDGTYAPATCVGFPLISFVDSELRAIAIRGVKATDVVTGMLARRENR